MYWLMDTKERFFDGEIVHSAELGFYFGEWDNGLNQAHGYGI